MFGSVRMLVVGAGLLQACAGGAKPLESPQPQALTTTGIAASAAPSATAAPIDPKLARLLELREEARELAERGALDVAARRLALVWEETRDAEALWQASLWAEEAWHDDVTSEYLDELAKLPAWQQRAEERRRSHTQHRFFEELDPAQSKAVDALLAKAQAQVEQDDSAGALASLEQAAAASPVADITRWVATLRWKLGEKRLAQLWWARTRASSGAEVAAAHLIVVPQLHYANASFALRPTLVTGWPFKQPEAVMALQFPTANGWVLGYAPAWGVTFAMGADASESRYLMGPSHRSKKPHLDPTMQPLAALALPHSIGIAPAKNIAARALSDDEQTLALLSTENELWIFKLSDEAMAELVYRGPAREAGAKPATEAEDSPMVHARRGKAERLYLASGPATTSSSSGLGIGLDLLGSPRRGDVLELDTAGRVLSRIRAHAAPVTALAVTRSGQYLATAAGKSYKVWDLTTRRAVYEAQAERPIEVVHFHPSDEVLEVASDFLAERIDWRQKKPLGSEKLDETVYRTHSRDGRYTATGLYKHEAIGVRREGSKDWHWVEGSRDVTAALSDDGKQLLLGYSGLWLFELEPWRATPLVRGYAATPTFSPSGQRIAACLEDGIAVFDRSGERLTTIAKKSCPEQLEFASEDELVVAGRSTLEWFGVPDGRSRRSEPGKRFYRLKGGDLRLRDRAVEQWGPRGKLSEHAADVVGISHSRGRFIIGQRRGAKIQAFDEAGTMTGELPGQQDLEQLAISDDGQLALAAISQGGVALFDLKKQKRVRNRYDLHAGLSGTESLQLLGGFALTAGSDGLVIWDVEHSDQEATVSLLENGDWFSVATSNGTTAVDGSPEGIDHVVLDSYFYHPGSVWEALREQGSVAKFLRRQLRP